MHGSSSYWNGSLSLRDLFLFTITHGSSGTGIVAAETGELLKGALIDSEYRGHIQPHVPKPFRCVSVQLDVQPGLEGRCMMEGLLSN
jgi:hypothetical protein